MLYPEQTNEFLAMYLCMIVVGIVIVVVVVRVFSNRNWKKTLE